MSKTGLAIAALCSGLLVLTAPAARAGAPSFDCDGARSDVERLICGDDELAALDVKLAKRFATVLSKAPADAVSGLKASQKSWRQKLMKCSKSGDPRGCAKSAYDDRLGNL